MLRHPKASPLWVWAAVIILACWSAPLWAQPSPQARLARAIHQEETLRDLEAAAEAYQQLAASDGCPAEIAAQADLRAGLCLSQLGRTAQARAALSRVASLYPEQPAADLARRALAELTALDPARLMPEDVFLYIEMVQAGEQLDSVLALAGSGDLHDVWLRLNSWMRTLAGRPQPSTLWQISRRRALAELRYLRLRLEAYEVLAVEDPQVAADLEEIRPALQRCEQELARMRSAEPDPSQFDLPAESQARDRLRQETLEAVDALQAELRQAREGLGVGRTSTARVALLELQALEAQERLAALDRSSAEGIGQASGRRPARRSLIQQLNTADTRRELRKVQALAMGLVHVDWQEPAKNNRFLIVILPGESRVLRDLAMWMGKSTGRFLEEREGIGLYQLEGSPILGVGQDVIMLGQDLDLLRDAVRRTGGSTTGGLAALPSFRCQLAPRRADSDLLVFGNPSGLLRSAERGLPGSIAELWTAGRQTLGLDALGEVLCSVNMQDRSIEVELWAAVDQRLACPVYSAVRTAAYDRELLEWVPSDVLLAVLGGIADGSGQWQAISGLAELLHSLNTAPDEGLLGGAGAAGQHSVLGLELPADQLAAVSDLAVIWPAQAAGGNLSAQTAVFALRVRNWQTWTPGLRSLVIALGADPEAAQAWVQAITTAGGQWATCTLSRWGRAIHGMRAGSDCLLSADATALEAVLSAHEAGQTAAREPAWRERLAELPAGACKLVIGQLDRLTEAAGENRDPGDVRLVAFTLEQDSRVYLRLMIDSLERPWWAPLDVGSGTEDQAQPAGTP